MLKNLLSIFIIVSLTIGIFSATVLAKPPKKIINGGGGGGGGSVTPTLYVDPSTNRFRRGETFTINIKLADVTDLIAFEFKLGYDTRFLDVVGVSMTPPSIWGNPGEGYLVAKNSVDEAAGLYWVAVAKLRTVPPFDGSTSLATITFKVTGGRSSSLDLYNTILANSLREHMPHNVNDGNFVYRSGGGCPTLFVYDGEGYVKERKSRLHSQEGIDIIDEIVLKTKPVADNGVYSLSLKETTLPEHSYIDNVRLFVIDSEGKKEAQLISAWHSKYGDVTPVLKESDDVRTDTKVFDSIDLKFLAPELNEPESFLFTIEGYNPASEIPDYLPLKIYKLDMLNVLSSVMVIAGALLIIVVIFAVMKYIPK